jgi:hypothetical protein
MRDNCGETISGAPCGAREIPEQVVRAVLRRARNRCEGWVNCWRMKGPGARCGRRATAENPLELVVGFWAAIAGEGIRVRDVTVLCGDRYTNSETAQEWGYWDYLLAKAD